MKHHLSTGPKGVLMSMTLSLVTKLKSILPLSHSIKPVTLVTMSLSLFAIASYYGWKFAAGFIYLLFIHELGHLAAAIRKGIPTSPAIFIPFVGALIGIDPKHIKDAREEAYLAFGGPLFGLFSLIPFVVLYAATKEPFWALMIQVGGLLNLLNMIPVSPLDGGRIVSVLSTKIWLIGLIGLGIFAFISKESILFLILIVGGRTWWERFREDFAFKKLERHFQVLGRQITRTESLLEQLGQLPPVNIDIYSDQLYSDEPFKGWQNDVTAEQKKLDKSHFKTSISLEKGFLPYIHDDKKLRKHEAELESQYTIHFKKLHMPVSREEMKSFLIEIKRYFEEEKLQLDEEERKLKTYFITDMKTKLTFSVFYLLLSALLALAFIFGSDAIKPYHIIDILDPVPELEPLPEDGGNEENYWEGQDE